MSTFTTRCPACQKLNRIPLDRVSDRPRCGTCQASLLDGAPIEGTLANFDALLKSDQPVVVDFWAPWCNPCIGFAPIFTEEAKEHQGRIRFVKVDTEAQPELAGRFQIRSIPTIMVFKEGKMINMINGALPKSQFNQWVTQVITQ